jgi:hypothetical protein
MQCHTRNAVDGAMTMAKRHDYSIFAEEKERHNDA